MEIELPMLLKIQTAVEKCPSSGKSCIISGNRGTYKTVKPYQFKLLSRRKQKKLPAGDLAGIKG